jgi:hypothetical protein
MTCIYIYIYIERERERETELVICTFRSHEESVKRKSNILTTSLFSPILLQRLEDFYCRVPCG